MHIDTIPHHRHFIAIPLVSVLFALLFAAQHETLSASEDTLRSDPVFLEAGESGLLLEVSQAAGFHAFLAPGTRVRKFPDGTVDMEEGTAFFRAERYGSFLSGVAEIHFFFGNIFAVRRGDVLTVAAMDTPALLSSGSMLMLIPPGHQVRLEDTSSDFPAPTKVPGVWQESAMLDAVSRLPSLLHMPSVHTSSAGDGSGDPLDGLPTTELRPDDLFALLGAAQSIDASLPLEHLLCATLLMQPHHPDLLSLLASCLPPRSFEVAHWSAGIASAILATPRPVHGDVMHAWIRMAKRDGARSPADAAQTLLPLSLQIADHMDRKGFPRSARAWEAAYADLRSFLYALLPSVAWEQSADEEESSAVSGMPHDDPILEVRFDIEQSYSMTYDAFSDVGALFTVDTTFTPLLPDFRMVRFDHVVLATARGLVQVDGTYDVVTGMVHRITRDGKRLPNAVPLRNLMESH